MLIAAVLAVLALPAMGLIALAVRLESRGPAIYRQRRVGRNGCEFTLLKFRTMPLGAERADAPVWGVPDDPRATRLGGLLRRTGLDELPQLFNVLAGHMNLVGPRPERPEIVSRLRRAIPGYDARHAVRPGITGWAQLNHPPDPTVAGATRKLALDVEYVQRRSPALDVWILVNTPGAQRRRSHALVGQPETLR